MNIENYVRLNDEGKIEVDKDAFQSALDSEISRAVDKYAKGKGRDEIRKQLEEEAKLTADEKLKAEREEFESYKRNETIKLNQERVKAKLEGKFSDKEIAYMLKNVGTDAEESLKTVETLITEREKFIADTQKKAIEDLQKQQQKSGSNNFSAADNEDKQAPTKRTNAEILSYYNQTPTQNLK